MQAKPTSAELRELTLLKDGHRLCSLVTAWAQLGDDDPMAPVSTLRLWKNGSNMDINELQEGSTIFIPVFLKGGLIWTGDSHCRQGNGEVNLTALECSYKEIRIQPIVRKDMKIEWPFIETRTHWISVGLNEDLNVAMPCRTWKRISGKPTRSRSRRADALADTRAGASLRNVEYSRTLSPAACRQCRATSDFFGTGRLARRSEINIVPKRR
jgi:Acetamidase/Formamidase family